MGTRAVIVTTVVRDSDRTMASRLGAWPEWLLTAARARRPRRGDWLATTTGRGGWLTTARRRLRCGRTLVIIPTYNERANLEPVVAPGPGGHPGRRRAGRRRQQPGRHRGDRRPARGRRRPGPRPAPRRRRRGSAGPTSPGSRGGWSVATTCWSRWTPTARHQPEQLERLLAALDDADLVLGSRWVPGGGVRNWPRQRELLSRGGSLYARTLLGLPIRDVTGGYRAFRRSALERLDLDDVASAGLLLPGRPGDPGGPGRAAGGRGADHVRRARARRRAR